MDPKTLTPSKINAELDRLARESSRNNDALIAAGRGQERFTESRVLAKAGDLLAIERCALADQGVVLHDEIARRWGPGRTRALTQR